MQDVTLLIAVILSVIIFCSAPVYNLIIYIAALAWYPSYLAVSIGTIDFTLCRMVILAIYANVFLRAGLHRRFKFIWLDKIVIIYFCCQVLAGSLTSQSITAFLENRAGAVFDMVLPYFAVRLIVTSKNDYLTLLKGILIISAPLATVGFYQCLTGDNPVGFFRKYHAWKVGGHYVPILRHGFFRADVTFPMSIMYGLFFSMFGPVCAGLVRSINKSKTIYWMGLSLMGVGVFSSMSSGPMLAAILGILFIMFYRWRKYWKPITIGIVIMCGGVEIISNRHFYDILGGFTLSPRTAWYRSRLIDVALFEGGMSGHWVTGFGPKANPGWNTKIDGRDHTDIVNHYLVILSRYGLVGLLPFLAMNAAAVKRLIEGYKICYFESDKWLIWCLTGALVGLLGALSSVSLFGQPTTIYYMMLGFVGIMPVIVTKARQNLHNSASTKYI